MPSAALSCADATLISTSFQRLVPTLVLQNERVARKLGMLGVDVQTLHLIALQDGPITPSTVAALTELPASTVTRVLDRLESRGFIRRITHGSDQRKSCIQFNAAKVAPVRAMFDEFARDFLALTGAFNAREQATIARFMKGLAEIL